MNLKLDKCLANDVFQFMVLFVNCSSGEHIRRVSTQDKILRILLLKLKLGINVALHNIHRYPPSLY